MWPIGNQTGSQANPFLMHPNKLVGARIHMQSPTINAWKT
jgi:hypothetical protein